MVIPFNVICKHLREGGATLEAAYSFRSEEIDSINNYKDKTNVKHRNEVQNTMTSLVGKTKRRSDGSGKMMTRIENAALSPFLINNLMGFWGFGVLVFWKI